MNVSTSVTAYVDYHFKEQALKERAQALVAETLEALAVSKRPAINLQAELLGRAYHITIWTTYKHRSITVSLELYRSDNNISVTGIVRAYVIGML